MFHPVYRLQVLLGELSSYQDCSTLVLSSPIAKLSVSSYIYHSVPSKCPWALVIHRPKIKRGHLHEEPSVRWYNIYIRTVGSSKSSVGTYMKNPSVRWYNIYIRTVGSSKTGVGAYMEMGIYLGHYGGL